MRCPSPPWSCFVSRLPAPDATLHLPRPSSLCWPRIGLGSHCIGARIASPVRCLVQETVPHYGFARFSHGRHASDAPRHCSGAVFWGIVGLWRLACSCCLDGWCRVDRASSKRASGTAHASVRGDLLVVLSMFAAIAWILISKRLMRRHSPVMVTASVCVLNRHRDSGSGGDNHIGRPPYIIRPAHG
jgi:hypothetical protein